MCPVPWKVRVRSCWKYRRLCKNRAIDDKTIAFGEIGLSGEVRGVSMVEQRVAEAAKLGFTTCVVPEVNRSHVKHIDGIRLIGVRTVRDAVDLI